MATASYSKYPQKWQERFAFFDAHGAPNSSGFKQALKAEPGRVKRKVNFNFLGFFFGPIYFLIVGLWRKAVVGLGILVASIIVEMILVAVGVGTLAEIIGRVIGFGLAILYGLSANYAYYLKEVKGSDSWNFFEGIRW